MATPSTPSSPRPTPAARRISRVFPALLLATACSQPAPPDDPETPAPAEPTPSDFVGHWKWSLVSEHDGVRRVELERWHLQLADHGDDRGRLRGRCERTVTFLAVDGRPFSCAQDLHYRLRAEYRFDAHLDDGSLAIIEREYRAEPSPCDSGERRLTGYRGRLLHRDQLQLRWTDGEQTLRRVLPPEPSPTIADATPQSIAGAWRWTTRNRRDAEVRVEAEDWQLQHSPDTGVLTGTVDRTVTVFEEDGARYPCSDDTFYRYRDRYTVRGVAGPAGVSLTETSVEPEPHPCLEFRDRHLDAATGAIVGEYLVLTWRGGKHQLLHRPLTDR